MSTLASNLEPSVASIADSMTIAIEAGDVDGWGATFAPDAMSWHSYADVDMPIAQNVELLRNLFASVVDELRYEDVRRYAIADGFVQQHQLVLQAYSGSVFRTGVCVIAHIVDGRIARMEEYLDSGVLAWGAENAEVPRAGTY